MDIKMVKPIDLDNNSFPAINNKTNNNNTNVVTENSSCILIGTDEEPPIAIPIKTPKRTIYFSDGIIEEFSEEENYADDTIDTPQTAATTKTTQANNDNAPNNNNMELDESKLTWGPWMIHKAINTGNTVLAGCDYVGESIAAFLGITTPKYSYELEQFKKMEIEHAEREKRRADNNWIEIKTMGSRSGGGGAGGGANGDTNNEQLRALNTEIDLKTTSIGTVTNQDQVKKY